MKYRERASHLLRLYFFWHPSFIEEEKWGDITEQKLDREVVMELGF